MLARLGYVLYWLGCGLAAVFLVFGVGGTYVAYSTTRGTDPWSWAGVAIGWSSWPPCVGSLGAHANTSWPANDPARTAS